MSTLADRYGAPVIIRGILPGLSPREAHGLLLTPLGFETYRGVTERAGRPFGALIQYIRPAGSMTATTPMFSRATTAQELVKARARRTHF